MITTAPELIYMLKVNIGIALFYAFYKLFCCRDTFFQWRRIALLSFLALSFLYPLMDMQAWVHTIHNTTVLELPVSGSNGTLPRIDRVILRNDETERKPSIFILAPERCWPDGGAVK